MKNLILFFVATLVLFSCNSSTTTENDTPVEGATEESLEGKHCFLEIKINEPYITDNGDTIQFIDSTILNLEIVGDKVTGVFDWRPAERDGAYGNLDGTIKDDIIRAMYSYTIEGYDGKEERIFKIMDDKIGMFFGELEEGEDMMLRIKDFDNPEYTEFLTRVNCK